MRFSLLLLICVAGIACQSGDDSGVGDTPAAASNQKAEHNVKIDWSGRTIRAGQETVYGWGLDKMAPSLRIRDRDGETPARDRPTWIAWRKKYRASRKYHNTSHLELHARIFAQTEKRVEENMEQFARGEVSYRIGINAFSDFTEEEFARMRMGDAAINDRKEFWNSANATNEESTQHTLMKRSPSFTDYRHLFQPVKHQGGCGSCYAFATTAAVEALCKRTTGQLCDFSEQHVVDCSFNYMGDLNGGCNGGHEAVSFQFLMYHGALNATSYPYVSGNSRTHGKCRVEYGTVNGTFKIDGFSHMFINSENELAGHLSHFGPIVVALNGEDRDFQDYKSGIFNRQCEHRQLNHLVVAVGNKQKNAEEYYILRNSWGRDWGMDGYMHIQKGTNICGVESEISYPFMNVQ